MQTGQTLGCSKGDTFVFEIDVTTDFGTVDLTDAAASWVLAESWFDGAKVYVTKDLTSGLFILQELGVWKVIVRVDPADTLVIPSGTLYHDCKVTLADTTVAHVASGQFLLDPSVNP